MLSFTTRHFLFRKTETWFYRGENIRETAYNVYPYAEAFKGRYDKKTEEETVLLNLHLNEEQLFAEISSTFRYHIRKAEHMGLKFLAIDNPSTEHCNHLLARIRMFAGKHGFRPLTRKRMLSMLEQNALFVMQIIKADEMLVTHLYLGDRRRVVLLASFHAENLTDKRLQSYANKLLHWKTILFFKQRQYAVYDFGGINEKTVPGITRFKLSFGGQVVTMENYIRVKPFVQPIFKLAGII